MDTAKLIERAKNILLTPQTEWTVVAGETATVSGLYTDYILILAAIPALAGFLKSSIIGHGVPLIGTVRIGIGAGLARMALHYGLGLVAVYVVALIVNALAPTFGGQKDSLQALKVTAYASTAAWVAGAFVLLPWLGWLLAIAGGIYSIYLVYLGLPATMRCAPERAGTYTGVTVLCAIILNIVIAASIGRHAFGNRGTSIDINNGRGSTVKVDADSALGKLGAIAKKMEAAGKKMEEAQKSGDVEAQRKAAGETMSAMFGGGQDVEALSPEQLKPFVPEKLGGFARTNYSVERNTMMGMQVAEGRGSYRDDKGERTLDLEITDMGSTKGLAALAGWAMQEVDRETDTGYEKAFHEGGRMVHEEWNGQSRSGTYSLVIADRFTVKLVGRGYTMDELKAFAGSLNLSGLEALKNSGVKPG